MSEVSVIGLGNMGSALARALQENGCPATGTSGCNEFGGDWTVQDTQITFAETVWALRFCDVHVMGQEEALQQVWA